MPPTSFPVFELRPGQSPVPALAAYTAAMRSSTTIPAEARQAFADAMEAIEEIAADPARTDAGVRRGLKIAYGEHHALPLGPYSRMAKSVIGSLYRKVSPEDLLPTAWRHLAGVGATRPRLYRIDRERFEAAVFCALFAHGAAGARLPRRPIGLDTGLECVPSDLGPYTTARAEATNRGWAPSYEPRPTPAPAPAPAPAPEQA